MEISFRIPEECPDVPSTWTPWRSARPRRAREALNWDGSGIEGLDEHGGGKVTGPFLIDTFDGGLVVIPLGEARRLAALNSALQHSTTWGQFLSLVAEDMTTRSYLEGAFDGELPDAGQSFDAEEVPGFGDGAWPAWPKQGMVEWLPRSVKELGTTETTMLNGDYLHLDEFLADEVTEALAADGKEGYDDPGTDVIRACGGWRYG